MSHTFDQAFDTLTERAGRLSLKLTDEQIAQLRHYCTELAQYNEHTNLVSDATPEVLVNDHILDSLTLVNFASDFIMRKRPAAKTVRLIDIGSGAGLPGMVLAIALPALDVTLLDSVGKKVRFLNSFIEQAHMNARVRAVCGRAETLAHQMQYREKFDLCTARAVGSTELIAELSLPFLMPGGELYLQKSLAQLDETSRAATKCLPKLGGAIFEATTLDATILGKERVVIVVEKRSKTASKYPREWPQMKSHPLVT